MKSPGQFASTSSIRKMSTKLFLIFAYFPYGQPKCYFVNFSFDDKNYNESTSFNMTGYQHSIFSSGGVSRGHCGPEKYTFIIIIIIVVPLFRLLSTPLNSDPESEIRIFQLVFNLEPLVSNGTGSYILMPFDATFCY